MDECATGVGGMKTLSLRHVVDECVVGGMKALLGEREGLKWR